MGEPTKIQCPGCGVYHQHGPRACVSLDLHVAHVSIAETRTEIERLRGIIEGARFFIEEDMLSCAAIILHGMGLDDGTDPSLDGTTVGAALIREHCDERDVIEAATDLMQWMNEASECPCCGNDGCSENDDENNHVAGDRCARLHEALAKLGDPR